MSAKVEATIDDLYYVKDDGKAEIVNGELVLMSPTGELPGRAALKIAASLLAYETRAKTGRAYGDNVGYIVNLPNRKSFSPDATFYIGPRTRAKFLQGAPIFAVEVRSEGGYSRKAEQEIADKRADYFAAGTIVVWDVGVLVEELIRCYVSDDPDNPRVFHRGETADAEQALPGWSTPVDDLFA